MSSPTVPTPPTSNAPSETTATPPTRFSAQASTSSVSDLSREIQAIMAARREMGPDYDDHFADILAERLTAQIQREVDRQVGQAKKKRQRGLSPEQRLGLAIPSLIFLIPLAAIGADVAQATGLIIMCLLVLAINIFAGFF